MTDSSDIEMLVDQVKRLNSHICYLAKKKIDVEMDFVSDDETDADLIDLISIKKRVWEPEYEEE